MSNIGVSCENPKNEKMNGKEEKKLNPENHQIKYYNVKADLTSDVVPKKQGVGRARSSPNKDKESKIKSELSYNRDGLSTASKLTLDGYFQKEAQDSAETGEVNSSKNEQLCASEESVEGDSTEPEERRSRRTAAINQRLLMKKIASHEPVIEVAEETQEVKRRIRHERRKINVIPSNDGHSGSVYEALSAYEEDPNYDPKEMYEVIKKYDNEEYFQEYVSEEKIPQEVLENPGEIYNFNEHEVKKKIKKVLVNKDHIFEKGLRYIEEYLLSHRKLIEKSNEALRKIGLNNVEVDTEYFYKFGGSYDDLNDQVDEVNKKIELLKESLNELHTKMGKSQMAKLNEPSVLYAFVSQTTNIKDKTLEYEEILEEMKDFQDLVNDEHKEKRRLFKNLIVGTSKQMLKVEQEYQKNDAERIKQVLMLYKNVSNMIDLFWKKIEKFAWEHLKKDLQQELIKKKKQNLDKFIQDAIKVSINDQERYIFDKKIKGTTNEVNREHVESSAEEESVVDESLSISEGKDKKVSRAEEVSSVDEGLLEDEYVCDKDEEKMELDDLKLEDEMDSDREENELDDLQKDLEMPLEELLKMYKQSSKSENETDETQSNESSEVSGPEELEDDNERMTEDVQSETNDGKSAQDNTERALENDIKSPEIAHTAEVNELSKSQDENASEVRSYSTANDNETATSKSNLNDTHEPINKVDNNSTHEHGSKSFKADQDDEGLLEDEYVCDKDEEKMELDDLKLEDEMDSDREENELDDLQKDLEMPLEELLKMYRQSSKSENETDETQSNESSEVLDAVLSDMSFESDTEEVGKSKSKAKEVGLKSISKSNSEKRQKTNEKTGKTSSTETGLTSTTGNRYVPLPPKRKDVNVKSPVRSSARTSPTRRTGDSTQSKKARETGSTRDRTQVRGSKDGVEESSGEVKVPFLIKAVLRPYQKEGLGWLVSLYERGINGILADEMGLGKTLQTICLLAYLACYKGNWGPHIIIVPTSILLNWVMEFNRFCPGFKVLAYYGSATERARKRIGWNRPHSFNVLVSSYSIVVQDAYVLKRRVWEYMILDEAQNIKNFHSKRWQTLLTFNTKYRLLLTGTPLQNSLQELWSLMHFILPNIFTSHTQFNIWFTDPLNQALDNLYSSNPLYKGESDLDDKEKEEMNRNNMELVEKLHVIFRPYLLRRLKKDVEKQMPSKYEHVLKCTLTKRQQVLYDEFISLYNLNSKGLEKERLSYRSMLNILMQLRKICNHPDQLKSRDVQIPIEFNIEPMQLPSMFKVIESGSIYNRRNRMESESGEIRNENVVNTVEGTQLTSNPNVGSYRVNSIDGPGGYGSARRVKAESGGNSQSPSGTRHSMRIVSRFESSYAVSTSEKVKLEQGDQEMSGLNTNFRSRNVNRAENKFKVESSPELRSSSSASGSSPRYVNTPTSRNRSGREFYGDGASSARSNNMVSPINSSLEGSVFNFDGTTETSPRSVFDNSPMEHLNTGVDNSPRSVMSERFNTVGGNVVNGLCMESYKRRRDRLILDKKIKRRRLDMNLNSECLIQYSAVSDGRVMDVAEDLTSCGYGFNYGKTHTNGLFNIKAPITRLTSTFSTNGNSYSSNICYTSNTEGVCNNNSTTNGLLQTQAGSNLTCEARISGNGMSVTSLTNPSASEALESVFNFNLKSKLELNKIIEAYFALVINFLVIATKVVSRPIRLFYSGETGVNLNNRNEWHLKEITTRMFERDDREYYAKNKVTLEEVNSQYRILFPSKRALNDDCGKFRVLGPLLLKLKCEGHRCIIYTQFSKMLDILENWINFMGFTYTRLDGSTKIDMRQKIVNRFNENTKIFLFISSTRSGGVGITLTGADTVIFYDTDWNPAIDRQAMDRCHRIGQTKDVNVYRLISEHTVEENIWRKQLQKRKLDDLIVDQGQFDIQHNAWFSDIDTLINIFQSKKDDDDEEDIYGKKTLHESNVDEVNLKGTGVKSLKMLIEVEDADDSMALQKLTKENEKINKEDFENDMINTIPGLVTYCIKFLLKYQTTRLQKQVETMKLKIQVEDYHNKQGDEEEEDDDIYTDYSSNEEVNEGSNQEEEDEEEESD